MQTSAFPKDRPASGAKLLHLMTLQAVIREGSLAKAAVELGVSPSSISERLAALEREARRPLFERSGRALKPTAVALALLPVTQRMCRLMEEASLLLQESEERERLSLAVTPVYGTYHLPALLQALRRDRPGVEYSIRVGQSRDVFRMVLDHLCELGIVTLPPAMREFDELRLCTDRVLLVAGPQANVAPRGVLDAEAFGRLDLIATEPGTGYWAQVQQFLSKHQFSPRITVEVDHIETMKRFVQAGLGVAFAPHLAVAEELRLGQLVEVALDPPAELSRAIYLVWLRERTLSPLCREFIHFAGRFTHNRSSTEVR